MPIELIEPKLNEPVVLKSKVFADDRGYFYELFKENDFSQYGIKEKFVQDNVSFSYKGVLRGLHYQLEPKAQAKLVTCIKGEVLDVMVDIRKGSPNYGKWRADILSDKNMHIIYVPAGFAHGFLTLSDEAIFLYKCSDFYAPDVDRGIIWNDPDLNIDWGIENPVLSPKDKEHPTFKQSESNFTYKDPFYTK